MPVASTYLILLCAGLFAVVLLIEWVRGVSPRRLLFQAAILVIALVGLYLTTGFPVPSRRQAFGGGGPLLTIGLMFVSILLGMAARYFFYLRTAFSWLTFIKPLCVSPIVLLPLLGAVHATARVEAVQLISFCFLAFQNGFFWRTVLDHAKSKI